MKKFFLGSALCAASISMIATFAQAEPGLYYGAKLGFSQFDSESEYIGETSGESVAIGGILGFRQELPGGSFWSVEGDLTGFVEPELSYDNGTDSCTGNSPDWCDLELMAHVRGIYGMPVGANMAAFASAGLAVASGRLEDGPVYDDATGTGFTVGLGVQAAFGTGGTGRVELVYDKIDNTNHDDYEKTLEVVSLQASYLF